MPAKKTPDPVEDPEELVPMNFRAPRRLGPALDAWAEELNKGRRWPKLKRSDLIRLALDWAAENRPNIEQK